MSDLAETIQECRHLLAKQEQVMAEMEERLKACEQQISAMGPALEQVCDFCNQVAAAQRHAIARAQGEQAKREMDARFKQGIVLP